MSEPVRLYRNWISSGSEPYSTFAGSYGAFGNLPGFTNASQVVAAGFKAALGSNITVAQILLYNTDTRLIYFMSDPINSTVVDGETIFEIDSIEVTCPPPFGVAIRAVTGGTLRSFSEYGTEKGVKVAQVYNPRNLSTGDTMTLFGGGSTSATWGSYVDVTDYIPIESQSLDGVNIDSDSVVKALTTFSGQNIDIDSANKSLASNQAHAIFDILSGSVKQRVMEGIGSLGSETGTRNKILSGIPFHEIKAGPSSKSHLGYEVEDSICGSKINNQFSSIDIDSVRYTSNAECQFNLVVTPTHQYRSQIVTVEAKNSQGFPRMGRYQLEIDGTIVIPYGPADIDLRDISFELMPSQLITGDNLCRLNYLYPDGSREYLDFKIFKEELRRTVVERLFRSYDGGYDGNKLKIILPQSFGVPDEQTETLIKTTDYTNIPLPRYTAMQGVSIEANGALILVSFDKGLTWKSLVDETWQTVELSNISVYGMDVSTINSITLARWQEIFAPTAIDFAVYLNRSLSSYLNTNFISMYGPFETTNANTSPVTYYPPSLYGISYVYATLINNGIPSATYLEELWEDNWTALTSLGLIGTFNYTKSYSTLVSESPMGLRLRGNTGSNYGSLIAGISPITAYLKSINVQITPRLKTGYAFIM